MFVYTIQPVVKRVRQPVWQPCWTNSCSFNRLSNRVVQPVWQPAVYMIQLFVKTVVKPVWQPVVSCIQTFMRLSNRFDNPFDNRLYRVNGALHHCNEGVWCLIYSLRIKVKKHKRFYRFWLSMPTVNCDQKLKLQSIFRTYTRTFGIQESKMLHLCYE